MSTSPVSSLPAGIQQLYSHGLLSSNLSTGTLKSASASQLNKLVGTSIAMQEAGVLLGTGSGSATDTANLSSTAQNALLQEINPSSTNSNNSAATDPLTAAVNNSLTSALSAAVSKFEPTSSTTTGSQINLLG